MRVRDGGTSEDRKYLIENVRNPKTFLKYIHPAWYDFIEENIGLKFI